MAITLRRLIEKVSHLDVTLLAGGRNLDTPVTWVHMVEASEVTDFLDGGEIAFITGIGISSPSEVLPLVEHIHEKHASAVMINTGPFLEKIPPEVINYCEETGLPLFNIPWRIHLAKVMQIFCYAITKEDRRDIETAAAFKNALLFPKQEELYVVPLSSRGFPVSWKYAVCVIGLDQDSSEIFAIAEHMANALSTSLHHTYKNFSIFSSENRILAIAGNYDQELLHAFIHDLQYALDQACSKDGSYTIGVGKTTKSIRCLFKSYRQAEGIRKLQALHRFSKDKIYYEEMGLYKLLMNIDDRDILEDYYEHTIKPLDRYDKNNDSNLVEVLQCYLQHDGSVQDTANILYLHRNTVNYKLAKIRELTGMNLSTLDARIQLATGLMLHDIL